jgi:4-hydroxy 2-oxovalerate aldolase
MPYSDTLDVRVTDTCLRDGSHAKHHQFTEDEVRSIVRGLDDAGMPVIEVTHGTASADRPSTTGSRWSTNGS